MRRSVFAALVALSLSSAGDALADDDQGRPRGSPYRLRWGYDAAFVGLGAATTMPAILGHSKPACFPGCEPPPGMLGIDDAVVGNYSPPAHRLATLMVFGLVVAPLAIHAADTRFDGWFEDSFVILESILLSQAITQVTKSAVGRPAPFVYNPNAAQSDLDSPDAFRSFVSGHSSSAFAAATAYTFTFWKRHPTSPWRFVVLGVSHAIATSIALLKIEAGYHYPTDVTAGALVGSSTGLLVPMLHSQW